LRAEGVKPVIKHREFGWHGIAINLLQYDTIFHHRSNTESTFLALRRNTMRPFALKRCLDSSANSS
jgi:hypothetical protein